MPNAQSWRQIMIELVINGQHLPVRQKPLSFRFKNPLVHKADGSIVYNLEVAKTPVSREVFEYIDRLDALNFGQPKKIMGELYVQGILLGHVLLKVDSSGEYYRITAGLNRGLFNFNIHNLRLRDVLQEVEVTLPSSDSDRIAWIMSSLNGQLPFYCFPVYNAEMFAKTEDWPGIIPYRDLYNWKAQNFYYLETEVFGAAAGEGISPFFKLYFIINELVKKLGFNLKKNSLAEIEELRKLTVYNNNAQFITDTHIANIDAWKLGDFVPDMSVIEFFDTIELIFNAKLIPDSRKMEARFEFADRHFDPVDIIDLHVSPEAILEIDYSKRKSAYKFSFEKPNCSYYTANVNDYQDKKYSYIGEFPTIGDFPTAASQKWGSICKDASTQSYYLLSVNDSLIPIWRFFSYNFQPEYIGESDSIELLEAKASPVITGQLLYSPSEDAVVPIVGTNGVGSSQLGPYVDPGGLRLIFYRGMYESSPNGYPYPLGCSTTEYNGIGEPPAMYSIRWQGEDGLLNRFWKNRLRWMKKSNLPVQVKKSLSIADLSNWEWTSGYLVGGRKCLSSFVEGEILPNGAVNATIELFPL